MPSSTPFPFQRGRPATLLVAALALAACSDPADPPHETSDERPRHEHAEHGHAPAWQAPPQTELAAGCADCHPDHAASWSRTGMARALGPIEPEELRGIAALDDAPAGYRYALEADADGPRLVETRPDTPDFASTHPIAFGIGAGIMDRSYAAERGRFL